MLVLSRKRGESIEIGDNVKVSIIEIRGGTVRIGIEAPREVQVSRPDAKCKVELKEEEKKPEVVEDLRNLAPLKGFVCNVRKERKKNAR